MLEKAVGDIRQIKLDINEYLDKVESDVVAKIEKIMKENETLLIKIEDECQRLSIKLEKIKAMLNSELFQDNALFIHSVECKPKVSECVMALSDMKSKTMKKYEFVPDKQLLSLSTSDENLGTVAISTMNVCHQIIKRDNDEESEDNGHVPTVPTRPPRTKSKSEQQITVSNKENEIKGQYKKEDSKRRSPYPTPRQKGAKNNLEINLESQEKDALALSEDKGVTTLAFQYMEKQQQGVFRGASKVTPSEDSDFEYESLSTKSVENVTNWIWQVMQIEKRSKIDEFLKSGGTMKYEENKLELSKGNQQTDDDMFDDYFNVFNTFVKGMESKEICDIPVDDGCSFESISTWQHEIEETLQRKCCTYFPNENKIIAYCDWYEELKTVEHLFLVKQGKKKPTGRRRKGIELEQSKTLRVKKREFDWSRDAKSVKTFKTYEGIQVYVYQADILHLGVDCIVNAANGSLKHVGGVAEAIARSAGRQLTNEGDLYINTHGNIPVGNVISTTAGNLPYKKVIHAVGPCWSDYSRTDKGVGECEQDLCSAIFNSCKEATEIKCQSIAFPALSSAIFGVPEDLCVCQYVQGTIKFSKKYTGSLKEVHFIDKNASVVRQIQREFQTVLENGNETPYKRESYLSEFKNGGHMKIKQVVHSNKLKQKKEERQYENNHENLRGTLIATHKQIIEKDAVIYLLNGHENRKLRVSKDDLLQCDSSAVVVTLSENRQGDVLARGIETVMKKAYTFDIYKEEVQRLLPEKSKVGQIAITKGYTTHFSHVVHVVFPHSEKRKNKAERQNCLLKIYKAIFSAAIKDKDVKVIATALIGIDKTPDDTDLGCNVFLDGYLWFLQKLMSERMSGPEVHLVCQEESNFQRICSTFSSFLVQSSASHAQDFQSSLKVKRVPEKQDQDCVICMDEITFPKTLKCGHSFCTDCIDKYFDLSKKICPTCGDITSMITGDQPIGHMDVSNYKYAYCEGYPEVGQIVITYSFSSGKQGPNHPSPGSWYDGITRRAYLPDNEEGQKICKMLRVAFDRDLVFTIGRSRTTGKEGVITWNDIHHKTDPRPYSQFGYPDKTYLSRVKDELAAKGVTEDDIN